MRAVRPFFYLALWISIRAFLIPCTFTFTVFILVLCYYYNDGFAAPFFSLSLIPPTIHSLCLLFLAFTPFQPALVVTHRE